MSALTLDRATTAPTLEDTKGILERAEMRVSKRLTELSNDLMQGRINPDEIDRVEIELRNLRSKLRLLGRLRVEIKRLMD